MKLLPSILPILAALALQAGAVRAEGLPLRISADGLIRFRPQQGVVNCSGNMHLSHASFRITGKGSATLNGGPALTREKAPADAPPKIEVQQQWISLVALGELTLVTADESGAEVTETARRIVFLPEKRQLIIDGKPRPLGERELAPVEMETELEPE